MSGPSEEWINGIQKRLNDICDEFDNWRGENFKDLSVRLRNVTKQVDQFQDDNVAPLYGPISFVEWIDKGRPSR